MGKIMRKFTLPTIKEAFTKQRTQKVVPQVEMDDNILQDEMSHRTAAGGDSRRVLLVDPNIQEVIQDENIQTTMGTPRIALQGNNKVVDVTGFNGQNQDLEIN